MAAAAGVVSNLGLYGLGLAWAPVLAQSVLKLYVNDYTPTGSFTAENLEIGTYNQGQTQQALTISAGPYLNTDQLVQFDFNELEWVYANLVNDNTFAYGWAIQAQVGVFSEYIAAGRFAGAPLSTVGLSGLKVTLSLLLGRAGASVVSSHAAIRAVQPAGAWRPRRRAGPLKG